MYINHPNLSGAIAVTRDRLLRSVNDTMESTENVLENIELPADFAEAFQHIAHTTEDPTTLAECIDVFERMMETAGVTVSVEQMYQPEPTRHTVHVGDGIEHVPCILDALLVALLVDADPVEIESEPPNGDATIHLRVSDGTIEVQPSTAVFSIGLAFADAEELPSEALGQMETAVSMTSCAYINAFADEPGYDRWESQLSDAVVMRLDANEIHSLATEIATGWVFTGD